MATNKVTVNPITNLIAEMVRSRDEALLSLDEATIRAYGRKYNLNLPSSPLDFWGGVHKARANITTFPQAERDKSIAWLVANGMTTMVGRAG